ncbi:MAG: hypothetical protein R6U13_06400 [Desulfatiglandaceae bacterium]
MSEVLDTYFLSTGIPERLQGIVKGCWGNVEGLVAVDMGSRAAILSAVLWFAFCQKLPLSNKKMGQGITRCPARLWMLKPG